MTSEVVGVGCAAHQPAALEGGDALLAAPTGWDLLDES